MCSVIIHIVHAFGYKTCDQDLAFCVFAFNLYWKQLDSTDVSLYNRNYELQIKLKFTIRYEERVLMEIPRNK